MSVSSIQYLNGTVLDVKIVVAPSFVPVVLCLRWLVTLANMKPIRVLGSPQQDCQMKHRGLCDRFGLNQLSMDSKNRSPRQRLYLYCRAGI